MPAGDAAHSRLVYVTPAGFAPYVGQWQEWIEPLDEAAETTPAALSLLARYGGGVFVVRQAGVIVAFAGLRNVGAAVTEIAVCTEAAVLRGQGLGRALLSRATKAVLAADRVPLVRYPAREVAAQRMAERLGYRPYADAVTYFAPA
jgi:GNAT superfamily N-acetyltransferase